jgi:hypothetical protein
MLEEQKSILPLATLARRDEFVLRRKGASVRHETEVHEIYLMQGSALFNFTERIQNLHDIGEFPRFEYLDPAEDTVFVHNEKRTVGTTELLIEYSVQARHVTMGPKVRHKRI